MGIVGAIMVVSAATYVVAESQVAVLVSSAWPAGKPGACRA